MAITSNAERLGTRKPSSKHMTNGDPCGQKRTGGGDPEVTYEGGIKTPKKSGNIKY